MGPKKGLVHAIGPKVWVNFYLTAQFYQGLEKPVMRQTVE